MTLRGNYDFAAYSHPTPATSVPGSVKDVGHNGHQIGINQAQPAEEGGLFVVISTASELCSSLSSDDRHS